MFKYYKRNNRKNLIMLLTVQLSIQFNNNIEKKLQENPDIPNKLLAITIIYSLYYLNILISIIYLLLLQSTELILDIIFFLFQ